MNTNEFEAKDGSFHRKSEGHRLWLNATKGQRAGRSWIILAVLATFFAACEPYTADQRTSGGLLKGAATMQLAREIETAPPVIPPIDAAVPSHIETATFAMGWFWGPDSRFGSLKGVVRTRVGYAGGEQPSPTYRSIGDHTETLQVDYDPAQISYDELLAIFWDAHDPTARSWSRQYMAAVFYHNDTQNKLASESKAREALRRKGTVHTGILPFTGFFLAEDYHQKYTLRNRTELMREFQQFGFSATDLVNSTAAARVNGYLGGNGTSEQFEGELELLGLSENGKNLLRKSIENR